MEIQKQITKFFHCTNQQQQQQQQQQRFRTYQIVVLAKFFFFFFCFCKTLVKRFLENEERKKREILTK